MTLVVVAKGIDSERPSDARRGVGELLGLASKVLRAVEREFTPTQLRVWEGFPGEGLGGELRYGPVPIVGGQVNLSNLLPSSDRRLDGDANQLLSEQFTLQQHHALEVSGRFAFGAEPDVPAWLHLNLYRPWATKAGDLVFDSSKTASVPYDGFFNLLASDKERAIPILHRLMEGISEGSKDIGRAARVQWAAVKDTEGTEEPSFQAVLAEYRGRTAGRHALLYEALREGAVPIGYKVSRTSETELPEAFVFAVVEDIVREIEGAPSFDPVASGLEDSERIEYVQAGSSYYILPDPEAVKRVADRILSTLRPHISKAVQARLGDADSWDRALSRLAKRGGPSTNRG